MHKKLRVAMIFLPFFCFHCSAVVISFSTSRSKEKQTIKIHAALLHELLHNSGFSFTSLDDAIDETLSFTPSLAPQNYAITSDHFNESIHIINIHLLNIPLNIEISLLDNKITNMSIHLLSNLSPSVMYFLLSFGFQISVHDLTSFAQNEVLGLNNFPQVTTSFISSKPCHQSFNRRAARPFPRGVSNPFGTCRNRVCANPVLGAYPK